MTGGQLVDSLADLDGDNAQLATGLEQ